MSDVADFTQRDTNAMLDVDRAHKAVEKINVEIDTAVQQAIDAINAKYSPISFLATSVLYEAMGRAAEAGFTRQQMHEVMDCDGH
jgi:hypothetical protein